MGLGLSQYIPSIIYYVSFLVVLLTVFYKPKYGILFLFPLLPFQNLFEAMQPFLLGKDLNDIIYIFILIGLLFKGEDSTELDKGFKKDTFDNLLPFVILIYVGVSTLGFISATLSAGASFDISNEKLLDWKNYMLLPLTWYITFKGIRNKKTMVLLTVLLILGIFAAGQRFRSDLKWMNVWHYSDKAKNMMFGIFVYLGANHYGAFFAHFVFILIGMFYFIKKKAVKILLALVIYLTVYCIAYTFSRGAYIAFMAGLLFLAIVKDKKILILLVLFLIFWRTLVPVSVVERVDMTKSEQGKLDDSAAERTILWKRGIEMFVEAPVFGNGFNAFIDTTGRDAHNMYVKMLAEFGLLGITSFLILCIYAFISGWQLFRKSNDDFFKGLGLGFCACVISMMVTNYFGDRWSYLPLGGYFWVFFGLVSRALVMSKTAVATVKK